MRAISGAHFCSFCSSADSTNFSSSLMTWLSCLTVSFHFLVSKSLKVSSLFPLNFFSGSPLNFSSSRWFQNSR